MSNIITDVKNAMMPEGLCVIPEIKSGDKIEVHSKIKEGEKERVQRFQGIVIQIKGEKRYLRRVTVRKVVVGVGIERIFIMPSPSIKKVVVDRSAKRGRAKLLYLRDIKTLKTKIKYKI